MLYKERVLVVSIEPTALKISHLLFEVVACCILRGLLDPMGFKPVCNQQTERTH